MIPVVLQKDLTLFMIRERITKWSLPKKVFFILFYLIFNGGLEDNLYTRNRDTRFSPNSSWNQKRWGFVKRKNKKRTTINEKSVTKWTVVGSSMEEKNQTIQCLKKQNYLTYEYFTCTILRKFERKRFTIYTHTRSVYTCVCV